MLVREGVRLALQAQPDVGVVGLCVDLPGLLAAVAQHDPDVVVTDVRMPPTSTDEDIQAANALRCRIRTPRWWCCRSTPSRGMHCRCWRGASPRPGRTPAPPPPRPCQDASQ
jgi:CheY-like chemotaxis protein